MKEKIFLVAICIIPLTITLLISTFVFQRIPHVQDSIAQLFQAKIFASGKLYAISHPLKEFFDYTHMINNGKWYSQYPPGHALFLMIGLLFGMPWIINPLLGALSVIFIYLIGKELYTRRTGQLAAVLTIVSPFFLFMSSEYMSHASAMLMVSVFALFYVKTLKYRKFHFAIIAGAALGMCALIRPYTAFAVSIPFFIHGIILSLKKSNKHLPYFMVMCGLTIFFVLLLFLYNYITNGYPFRFGYTVLYGVKHGLGFGKATWGPPHTLSLGIIHLWNSLKALSLHLFGWPYISLVPLVVLVISRKLRSWDYLFMSSFICLVIAYVFYWFHDLCFGPRFMYEAFPFLVILSAQGILAIPGIVGHRKKKKANKSIKIAVAVAVCLLVLYNIFFTIPLLIKGDEPNFYWKDRGYGNSYWGVDAYLTNQVNKKRLSRSIVFVQYEYPVFSFDPLLWYGSGFLNNSPDLKDDVIYARHLGARDTLLMDYYPDRQNYIYTGTLRYGKIVGINKDFFRKSIE